MTTWNHVLWCPTQTFMWLFSSLFPVESPVELSKFGSGKVGLGLPKTPRVAPVGDSAVLIVPVCFLRFWRWFSRKKNGRPIRSKNVAIRATAIWMIYSCWFKAEVTSPRYGGSIWCYPKCCHQHLFEKTQNASLPLQTPFQCVVFFSFTPNTLALFFQDVWKDSTHLRSQLVLVLWDLLIFLVSKSHWISSNFSMFCPSSFQSKSIHHLLLFLPHTYHPPWQISTSNRCYFLIPGTQMTFVLNGKGLFYLWGWPSKIEVIKGFQAYIYIYICTWHASPGIGYLPLSSPHGCLVEGVHLFGPRFLPGIEVLHGKVTAWLRRRDPRFQQGFFPEVLFFWNNKTVWHQTEKEGNKENCSLKEKKEIG